MDERTTNQTQAATGDKPGPRIAPLSQGIAQRIRRRRADRGMSQGELAQRLGVTRQTVSNWECARTIPDAVALGAIARALDTTADELLGADAPDMRRRALGARREFLLVCGIMLVLQLVTMLLNAIALGNNEPAPAGGAAFGAFRLGVLVIGCVWAWHIARREGLKAVRQMIDFASLASAHPGGAGDRALRFVGRWFWTIWFALTAILYGVGAFIGIAQRAGDATNLIAPAFILLIGAIPYTWERSVNRTACARP